MLFPNFTGGSYKAQSPIAANEETINFYLEQVEVAGTAAKVVLYPTPGVDGIGTSTGSPGREHTFVAEREFGVFGGRFQEVAQDGTVTDHGAVAVDSNPATISYNGEGGGQLLITSGDNGYVFTLATNTLTQVRTGATTMGDHVDGYFLVLDAATSTLYFSALLDGATWDPLDFIQRSTKPDPWISMKVFDRYVWMGGVSTSDVYYNDGSTPFAPHPSGTMPFGTAAAFSAKVVAGSLMWLAQTDSGNGQVVRLSGFSPDVVSTFPLQVELASYATIADAVGDTYQDLGHTFYLLYFPTANVTWCFDATGTSTLPNGSRWTKRGTWLTGDSRYDAWRPVYHAFAFGEHRMLDRASGAIYRMSSDLGTDVGGGPIRRLRRPSGLWRENQRLFISDFEVYLETGLGLPLGQGSDPQIGLRISTDGGKTWGAERFRSAGALGQYGTRVNWTRCGSGRHWTPELVVSDPIPWRVLGAGVTLGGAA
jgi:hypothetical protein